MSEERKEKMEVLAEKVHCSHLIDTADSLDVVSNDLNYAIKNNDVGGIVIHLGILFNTLSHEMTQILNGEK